MIRRSNSFKSHFVVEKLIRHAKEHKLEEEDSTVRENSRGHW
jgi:hypothetical protein